MVSRPRQRGFTLIEMMIVVVIVGVLVTVAIIAYTRHIRSARLVGEQAFLEKIKAQQEVYLQQFGFYCDASGNSTGVGAAYPAESVPAEQQAWAPIAAEWTAFGVRPESGSTWFSWQVEASSLTSSHQLYGEAAVSGIQATPPPTDGGVFTARPWYYVKATADFNGNGVSMIMRSSSERAPIIIENEGE